MNGRKIKLNNSSIESITKSPFNQSNGELSALPAKLKQVSISKIKE